MARLFVGQRVRLVRKSNHCGPNVAGHPIGTQGRISSTGPFANGQLSWDGRLFDGNWDLTVTWDTGLDTATLFRNVEPVTNIDQTPAELTVEELLPFLKTREVV